MILSIISPLRRLDCITSAKVCQLCQRNGLVVCAARSSPRKRLTRMRGTLRWGFRASGLLVGPEEIADVRLRIPRKSVKYAGQLSDGIVVSQPECIDDAHECLARLQSLFRLRAEADFTRNHQRP